MIGDAPGGEADGGEVVRKSKMAVSDARLFGLYEAQNMTDGSHVGTSLKALGQVVRPRAVAASEVAVDAKMAAP